MLKTKTFTDVLLETFERSVNLNGSSDSSPYSFNAGWESTLDAYGMSRIMTQTPSFKFKQQATAYIKMKPSRPRTERIFTESSLPKHNFDSIQAKAFELLKALVPQLPENFSFNQLKSAYRRAALKTHPDRGGASETFQQVKKSYHILTDLVKNET